MSKKESRGADPASPNGAADAASPVPEVVAQPDPTVMLYLRAAAQAFPRVQEFIGKQIFEAKQITSSNKALATKLDSQTKAWVAADVEERKKLYDAILDMRQQKAALLKAHEDQKEAFKLNFAEHEKSNAKEISEMKRQIAVLEADSAEAEGWRKVRRNETAALRQVQDKLEETREAQEKEVAALREENDTERRKLRDLLVRKLRRVRDIMSSTTDDMPDGSNGAGVQDELASLKHRGGGTNVPRMLAKDSESAAAIASFATPTAKLNEKLSRAVTMYERESKIIAETITATHATSKQAAEQLEHQRAMNEKLVLRNASQNKAKSMLKQQLEELREKYKNLSEAQEKQELQRRRALQETVRMQGDVVSDLKGELEHMLNEYEEAVSELKSLEKQKKGILRDSAKAKDFFEGIVRDFAPSSERDPHAVAPPSGFVGNSSPPGASEVRSSGGSISPRKTPQTLMEMSKPAPGIAVLGLHEPREVAEFLALAVSSKVM